MGSGSNKLDQNQKSGGSKLPATNYNQENNNNKSKLFLLMMVKQSPSINILNMVDG